MSAAEAAHEAGTPILRIAGLGRQFGGLKVLTHVSFDVDNGIIGLIGPNGSGKTTLFNIVSGFLPPGSGVVEYEGRDILRLSVQQRSRAGLLRTFQTPQVFEHMSVLENVMAGAHNHTKASLLQTVLSTPGARREHEASRARAEEVCAKFGLDAIRDTASGKLPAGQRRMVEIARAYVARPKLLLLDEPSSGLSDLEVAELQKTIRRLSDEGIAILLVSHDMELMSVCSIVHVLFFGEIIASGSMTELKANPAVQNAYLGA